MVAEDRPRCTVCGITVSRAGGLLYHVEDGRTALWRDEPYGHHATLAPIDQPADAG